MRRCSLVAVLALAATLLVAPAAPAEPQAAATGVSHRPVCGPAPAGSAQCDSEIVTRADGVTPQATQGPTGFGPTDLRAAYGLSGVSGGTVAIVDAYDAPNAEADLGHYRLAYGLTLCTTANGCFKKVDENGGTNYPSPDTGWAQEISLDLDMVSAICPGCHILLVEGASSSLTDLGTAVNTAAATNGVVAISNSYGTSSEFSGEAGYAGYYDHSGIAITVSSGDSGYGTSFPPDLATVVAVGGTSLTKNSNGTYSEKAWSGAGSGCSSQIGKPSYEIDKGCANRTMVDVSAVADPYTGVSVYDSYGSSGGNNWYVFGGTSVSSPIIASVFALGGVPSTISGANSVFAAYKASHAGFHDVTTGSNGRCSNPHKGSSSAYLCTAGTGYDGPTGLGTPNGVTAF
jgi:subtilase family serine protease